ncbi:LIM domain protein [Trichuris suis]|nr:LIM domain protein [Trichuris suis]
MPNLHSVTQDGKICSKCNEKILEVFCKAGDKVFHETCFTCEFCRCPLAKSGFQEKDEKIICLRCYAERMLPKCARCQLPVHQIRLYEDDYFEALLKEEIKKDQ